MCNVVSTNAFNAFRGKTILNGSAGPLVCLLPYNADLLVQNGHSMYVKRLGLVSNNATLQLFLASFLAGAGWVFSLHALEGLTPLLFIGSRFALAGMAVAVTTGRFKALLQRNFYGQILPGAAFVAISMIFWTIGLSQVSSPGISAFITATGNLMVPVFGFVIFSWSFFQSTAFALCVAATGLACLLLGPGAAVEMAHGYFAIAAALWAFGIVLIKRKLERFDAMLTTSGILFFSGAIILTLALPYEGLPATWPSLETMGWFCVSLFLSTYCRFVFQFSGQQKVSAGKAGLIMSLEPVWVLCLSIFLLGERPSLFQSIGCALVLGAILYENTKERRR